MNVVNRLVMKIMVYELLICWLVIDFILPVILPYLEPDRYKRLRWEYGLIGAWFIFNTKLDDLPPTVQTQLLKAGYVQISWFLCNGVLRQILRMVAK